MENGFNDGYVNGHAADQPPGYHIREQRLGEPLELRIITIGAGASGLNLAYQLKKHMRNFTHVIYEKNSDVGGTWFENRYPGYIFVYMKAFAYR